MSATKVDVSVLDSASLSSLPRSDTFCRTARDAAIAAMAGRAEQAGKELHLKPFCGPPSPDKVFDEGEGEIAFLLPPA
jgi:hypothetical protein